MNRGRETRYADTCEITGIENGVTVTGEILEFRHQNLIIATINRAAKVTLRWQEMSQRYVGAMSGVEFESPGPRSETYRTHR